jgi:hypothetical protein
MSPFSDAVTSPQFWAAVVAALAALAAAIASFVSTSRARKQFARERAVSFLRDQINDLFGAMYMRRRVSESLREILPKNQNDGSRFRLVNHIGDVKNEADPAKVAAVEQILQINRELTDIMSSKFALLDSFPPPASFVRFVAHARLLQSAWERGQSIPASERIPFPDELDRDIFHALETARSRLNELR